MDLPSANCFTGSKDYVAKIVGFSRQDARGLAYRPLADFLNNAWRYSHENDITEVTEEHFLWYYAIHPTLSMSPSQLLSPLNIRGHETTPISSACDGKLIFLRGYPSAERLALLGHSYEVEPVFWKRHLDFLSPADGALAQVYQPPSTASRIFQLRVGSIGTWGRFWQPHQHIEHLRRSAADDMKRYRNALAAGHNWHPADSVVRRYILHDKEHFTIEQNVTVLFHNNNNSNRWIGKSSSGILSKLLQLTFSSHGFLGLWERPGD